MNSPKLWNKHFNQLLAVATIINVASFILMTMLPLYVVELGGNNVSAGMLVTVFTFSALLFRPVFGGMVDHRGRKPVLLIGLVIFAVSSVSLVFVHQVFVIFVIRFVQGIGLSAFSGSLGTIVADVVPEERLAEGVGYFGLTGTVAMAIGPVTALWAIEAFGYETSFYMTFGVAVFSVVLGLFMNYEKQSDFAVFFETHRKARESQENTKKSVFSFIEKTSLRPCLIAFFTVLPVSVILSFMPLYAIERDIQNIGYFFTVYSIAMVLARVFGGKLVDRYGHLIVYIPASIMLVIMYVLLGAAQNIWMVLIAAALYGVGFGSVQPIFNAMVLKLSPDNRRGAANATYYATMDLGFGLGSFIWGSVSQYYGFGAVFYTGAIISSFSVLLYFVVLHKDLKQKEARGELAKVKSC